MHSTILVLADDAPAQKPPGIFDSLPLILLPILFLFLIFLPARKDKKQRLAILAGHPAGDRPGRRLSARRDRADEHCDDHSQPALDSGMR